MKDLRRRGGAGGAEQASIAVPRKSVEASLPIRHGGETGVNVDDYRWTGGTSRSTRIHIALAESLDIPICKQNKAVGKQGFKVENSGRILDGVRQGKFICRTCLKVSPLNIVRVLYKHAPEYLAADIKEVRQDV